jgi:hypothetical protein
VRTKFDIYVSPSPRQTASTDQQEDYDNLTTMPIKYHTVGLTSGRCRSSQELQDWNALPPDKASLDTLEAFKASICVQ